MNLKPLSGDIWTNVTAWLVVAILLNNRTIVLCNRLPYTGRSGQKSVHRVFYQSGNSESTLPVCSPWAICNRIDTYSTPWMEKQCTCPEGTQCPTSLDANDGHTIVDKSRQFKLCEPVSTLRECRFFKDVTWTYTTRPDNSTYQTVKCLCPKNSVSYIFRHQAFETPEGIGYRYSFACSPQSSLRCLRKEPCRLFTVKKRPDVEEVNTNTLCQCPHGYKCPQHHTNHHVISGSIYAQDNIKTYSGYCAATDPKLIN